ncbi:hypothetical protein GOEFS_017_00580 [Gordonia effusa NBRC 100432]|uniref:Uncharacterized protein n=1 Tax=Gordonia effusa NBRC 100432 TaxID=1077974 RepID=H0QVU1_9ACTN|nr:hypothetical protein GOEFS_017_00580 [Gordonia effusa NBRC 100432]
MHLTVVGCVQAKPDESLAALAYLPQGGGIRVLSRQTLPIDVNGTVDDGPCDWYRDMR